ncbi:MAG: hypothetical protein ABI894_15745 [Ilumatobacteraceae bacterium]
MTIDDDMNVWWNSLTADQQAEALTIPQQLPDWMADSVKASEILAHWPEGDQIPAEYWSGPLREFLDSKSEH